LSRSFAKMVASKAAIPGPQPPYCGLGNRGHSFKFVCVSFVCGPK